MLRSLLATAVLLATAAPAQITSYRSSNAASIKGDPDKVVCQRQEKIGTRLGAKKICLTVREWHARELADREHTEQVESGARARCSNEGGCNPPAGAIF